MLAALNENPRHIVLFPFSHPRHLFFLRCACECVVCDMCVHGGHPVSCSITLCPSPLLPWGQADSQQASLLFLSPSHGTWVTGMHLLPCLATYMDTGNLNLVLRLCTKLSSLLSHLPSILLSFSPFAPDPNNLSFYSLNWHATHCVVQTGLEFAASLLPQLPKFWFYTCNLLWLCFSNIIFQFPNDHFPGSSPT